MADVTCKNDSTELNERFERGGVTERDSACSLQLPWYPHSAHSRLFSPCDPKITCIHYQRGYYGTSLYRDSISAVIDKEDERSLFIILPIWGYCTGLLRADYRAQEMLSSYLRHTLNSGWRVKIIGCQRGTHYTISARLRTIQCQQFWLPSTPSERNAS